MAEILRLEELDSRDRQILFELDRDSRQPYAALGRKLRLSKENIKYRIKRLIDSGLIEGFYSFSDLPKMGFVLNKGYVRLRNAGKREEEAYHAFLREHAKVTWSTRCVGRYDSVFNVLVADAGELNAFLDELREKFGSKIALLDTVTITQISRCGRGYLVNKRTDAAPSEPKLSKSDLTSEDLKIMALLSTNARASLDELAKAADVSIVTVRKRLRELVAREAIQRFTLKLNYEAFDCQYVKIMFKLQNVSAQQKREFRDYWVGHPNSIYYVEGIGASDVDVDFELENIKQLSALVRDAKTRFPDIIRDYEILFVTKEDKLDFTSLKTLAPQA